MEKDLFTPVLDDGETILKTYRPSKLRAWFTIVFSTVVFLLFLIPVMLASIFNQQADTLGVVIGAVSFLVVYVIVSCILIQLWLNKTIYAVTNKRILIRTGYIGVDYKSLDYTMLGAITVNVRWIDKILNKNTGSLAFGSMASPMTNQYGSKFTFAYIFKPYETYKEVKSIIDSHKNSNLDK